LVFQGKLIKQIRQGGGWDYSSQSANKKGWGFYDAQPLKLKILSQSPSTSASSFASAFAGFLCSIYQAASASAHLSHHYYFGMK